MNIQKAMEIVRNKQDSSRDVRASVDYAIRKAWLSEHDDTPLTLELAKEVLGPIDNAEQFHLDGVYAGTWNMVNAVLFHGKRLTTIGDLHTLARLLRGGV